MNSKVSMIALGILAAGAMVAQTAQSPAPAAPQPPASVQGQRHAQAGNRQDRMVRRLTARLNLTPDQQTQVKAILKDSRAQTKALAPKFREERMALDNAIKSDSLGQIDKITQANINMNTQMAANHLKTIAKIYAILTPDQKAKFDQRFDRVMGVSHVSYANGA